MKEPQNWRDLIAELITNSQEKQRIAYKLKVNPITLSRWVQGKSNPRLKYLQALLDALPEQRLQLLELLCKEYPEFSNTNITPIEPTVLDIPAAFYAHILRTHAITPPILHTSTICALILQQMLAQLDTQRLGMVIFIAQCVPPRLTEQKVRSLRITQGNGTPPWNAMEYHQQFLGIESHSGYAVQTGHMVITHNQAEQLWLPINENAGVCTAAFPILYNKRVAGCICLLTKQQHSFSQAQINLIERYARLLVLAFEPSHYYDLEQINLGVIPAYDPHQQNLFRHFQSLVTKKMAQSMQEGRSLSRPQAELLILQDFEEQLLRPPAVLAGSVHEHSQTD